MTRHYARVEHGARERTLMSARATAVPLVLLLLGGCDATATPPEQPPPEGPYDVGLAGAYREYQGTRAGANAVHRTQIVGTSSGGFTREAITSFPAAQGIERV